MIVEVGLSTLLVGQRCHADYYTDIATGEEEAMNLIVSVVVTAGGTVQIHTVTGAISTVGVTILHIVEHVVQIAIRPIGVLDADVVGVGQRAVATDEEPLVVGRDQFVATITEIRTVVPTDVGGLPVFVVDLHMVAGDAAQRGAAGLKPYLRYAVGNVGRIVVVAHIYLRAAEVCQLCVCLDEVVLDGGLVGWVGTVGCGISLCGEIAIVQSVIDDMC